MSNLRNKVQLIGNVGNEPQNDSSREWKKSNPLFISNQ
jgi:hypothetical protein